MIYNIFIYVSFFKNINKDKEMFGFGLNVYYMKCEC